MSRKRIPGAKMVDIEPSGGEICKSCLGLVRENCICTPERESLEIAKRQRKVLESLHKKIGAIKRRKKAARGKLRDCPDPGREH